MIEGHVREVGLIVHLLKDVPRLISGNIEKSLKEAFAPLGINDWNSIWIAHPRGTCYARPESGQAGSQRGQARNVEKSARRVWEHDERQCVVCDGSDEEEEHGGGEEDDRRRVGLRSFVWVCAWLDCGVRRLA